MCDVPPKLYYCVLTHIIPIAMITGYPAHPPAAASVVLATVANVGPHPHPTGDPPDTLLLARGMSSRYLSSKTEHRLLPLSRANIERDLRHFEVHRSTCGGYAQQRFVHGNRELAGGGRFVDPAVARPTIGPAVAHPAIDPAVARHAIDPASTPTSVPTAIPLWKLTSTQLTHTPTRTPTSTPTSVTIFLDFRILGGGLRLQPRVFTVLIYPALFDQMLRAATVVLNKIRPKEILPVLTYH